MPSFLHHCLEIRQIENVIRESKQPNHLGQLQDEVAREKGVSSDTLRRLLAKVVEYSESHHAIGLPEDLLAILQDDLSHNPKPEPEPTQDFS